MAKPLAQPIVVQHIPDGFGTVGHLPYPVDVITELFNLYDIRYSYVF